MFLFWFHFFSSLFTWIETVMLYLGENIGFTLCMQNKYCKVICKKKKMAMRKHSKLKFYFLNVRPHTDKSWKIQVDYVQRTLEAKIFLVSPFENYFAYSTFLSQICDRIWHSSLTRTFITLSSNVICTS